MQASGVQKAGPLAKLMEFRKRSIEPELKIAFAITLKKERERLGLTQKDVAERLNVNWAYYQRIENPRKTNPTLGTIIKLQKVFNRRFISL